jgi:hypothetical protein
LGSAAFSVRKPSLGRGIDGQRTMRWGSRVAKVHPVTAKVKALEGRGSSVTLKVFRTEARARSLAERSAPAQRTPPAESLSRAGNHGMHRHYRPTQTTRKVLTASRRSHVAVQEDRVKRAFSLNLNRMYGLRAQRRALSCATLISLGADEIVTTPMAQLSVRLYRARLISRAQLLPSTSQLTPILHNGRTSR